MFIVTSTGSQDPTRASIDFHIAANGAVPAGQECGIALAGDATSVPPLADVLAACQQRAVRFYVD